MIYIDDLLKEIKQMMPVVFSVLDYFSNKPDPAWNVIQSIIDRVPNIYKDDLEWLDVEIATNGDELLFNSEFDCERFADALDKHIFGFTECHTGYYDPYEDAISGETDENSGWYYIDFD